MSNPQKIKRFIGFTSLIALASVALVNGTTVYEESNEWHANRNKFKTTATAIHLDSINDAIGLNYANKTKAELGKNLVAAIGKYGTAGAVQFCSTKAIPITDSMAKTLNVSVKRVSDKERNPKNKANAKELEMIALFKKKLAAGEKELYKTYERNGKVTGYYAIETNKICLQCHGHIQNDINPETLSTIRKLYPKDKATGYSENQIRGIWVIAFLKKNNN